MNCYRCLQTAKKTWLKQPFGNFFINPKTTMFSGRSKSTFVEIYKLIFLTQIRFILLNIVRFQLRYDTYYIIKKINKFFSQNFTHF